jgi:hypothetical protein
MPINTSRERLSFRGIGRISSLAMVSGIPIAAHPSAFLSVASCGVGSRAFIEVDGIGGMRWHTE